MFISGRCNSGQDRANFLHRSTRQKDRIQTPTTRLAGNLAENRLPTPGMLLISSCA